MNKKQVPATTTRSRTLAAILLAAMLASNAAHATTTFTKADNTNALNLGSSWVGGFVPGSSQIAQWNSTALAANTSASLGGNLSWEGISIVDPGAAVTISSGSVLTLGVSGIDMSAATQDLTISSGLTLGSGNQVWNVATGRTLALDTGTFTRTAGATMNIQGAGTVSSTMTGLTSAVQTNGILTWATVGTGTNTRFATFSGDSLVGYTGATAASTGSGTWDGIPSGGTGLINYDITVGGTGAVTGNARNVNSIRYSGTGAFTQASNTNNTVLMTTNAILNAGTGTFTIGTTGGTTLNVGIGSTNELVLNAANAGIVIANVISGAAGASVTVVGPNTVTLNGASTFTGGTTLNGGSLALGASSTGAAGSVTAGPVGTGTLTLNGGNLAASLAARTINNAVVVNSGTTTFSQPDTNGANLVLGGALTGAGVLADGVAASGNAASIFFTGNLSGFQGTFAYQNTNGIVNFRFGNNTGTTGTPLVATVDASQAKFAINASGAFARPVALTDNMSNSTLKMGELSGNGLMAGSFQGSGTQLVNTYEIGYLNTDTTFSGAFGQTATIANTTSERNLAITKVGTGSLTLSNTTSAYTGNTTVRDGKLIAGASQTSGSAGPFGTSTNAIILGDATTISSVSAMAPQLLTGGAFTVTRAITVGASNGALGNASTTFTIGGNTANTSTFSGVTTLNQNLSVTQVASGTLNLTGNITSGSSGTQTITFNNVGSVSQSTGVIGGGTGAIAVTQSGAGTTTLSGANTYTGATTVTAGTLATGSTGTFGAGNVSVVSGAALTFGNSASIADLSTLTFSKTSTAGSINLNFTGIETVGLLLDSVSSTYLAGGTYTATDLNTLLASLGGNAVFAGTGSLSFSSIPEPSTYAAIFGGLALVGAVVQRRRRNRQA